MKVGPDALHWPRFLGTPETQAILRALPEDFVVDEDLGFVPDGEGEHAWLRIRKVGRNTEDVARALQRLAGVRPVDVSYAGMKDRHAVTTQWFSVCLKGGPDPDWSRLEQEQPGVTVLEAVRSGRKLRRGALAGNRFTLLLRDVKGDRDALEARLKAVAERGVPNYFGPQRFGRRGDNVEQALTMFAGRKERNRNARGLYISAARSFLFNQVLGRRVELGCWDRALVGEALQLAGSGSFFVAEAIDEEIADRLTRWDLHPTGPLWGRGELPSLGESRALELEVAAPFGPLRDGLEHVGLRQERRSLRLQAAGLAWAWEPAGLRLDFALPAGSYATAVVAELVEFSEGSAA